MYADTDFFLALLLKGDRLERCAKAAYAKHAREIWTSMLTVQELLLLSYKRKLDPLKMLDCMLDLVRIDETPLTTQNALEAAKTMASYEATPFDAMHAVACRGDSILSSDKVYERMGLQRIKLEEFR